MDAALILKKQNDNSFTKFLEESWQRTGNPEKPSILVLGCHNGSFSSSLSDFGSRIVGLDKDQDSIKIANLNYSHENLNFLTYNICSDEILFEDKFDIVLDYHTSHCITDAKDRHLYFKFVKNHLKSEGLYISETMCLQKNMELPYDYFLIDNILIHENENIRFLAESFYLENELISNGLGICYFYHLSSFHFNIFKFDEVDIEKTPNLLRINCKLR